MKKRIIIITSSSLALIFLIVSIVLVLTIRPTTDNPPTDDDSKVDVKEPEILVSSKKGMKTRFFVGDEKPNLTGYFDIYEDLNPVEVLSDYILSELNMDESGTYDVKCTYKNCSDSVTIYIDDYYEMSVTEESVKITVGQTDVDYKKYFQLKKNGQTMDITDEMITVNVDLSKEGTGIVNCVYLSQSKNIRVIVEESKEPDKPDNPDVPDLPSEGVRLVVAKDLTFPVGTNVSLPNLCDLYDGQTKVDSPSLKFTTDLNVYMEGAYKVKVSTIYKYKEYSFDEFVVTITALSEVVISEQDVENFKKTILDSENLAYSAHNTPATYSVKNGLEVRHDDSVILVDMFLASDVGIMFYYDSDKMEDVITLSYLLRYYYANSSLISLPILYVLDINKEIAKANEPDATESEIALKPYLEKIKNENYTSLNDTKNAGATAKTGDLWVQGKFYYKTYVDSKSKITVLKQANNTYGYSTYCSYLDVFFNQN